LTDNSAQAAAMVIEYGLIAAGISVDKNPDASG
jgi:Flp pilus assembly pilin Flp